MLISISFFFKFLDQFSLFHISFHFKTYLKCLCYAGLWFNLSVHLLSETSCSCSLLDAFKTAFLKFPAPCNRDCFSRFEYQVDGACVVTVRATCHHITDISTICIIESQEQKNCLKARTESSMKPTFAIAAHISPLLF